MVEFKDSDKIERWLKDREAIKHFLQNCPHGDATLIAARAALRVAPSLAQALNMDTEDRFSKVLLPSFRALVVSSFAGTWPKKEAGLNPTA